MAKETTATKVVINKVNKAQFDVITKADNELYFVTECPPFDGVLTVTNAAGEQKVFNGTEDLDLTAGLLYSKEAKDFVTGGNIESGLNSKENKLTGDNAGTGISITRNAETGAVTIANTNKSAEWGQITGTLSTQSDLQDALDAKQDNLIESDSIKITNNVITAVEASVGGSGGSFNIHYNKNAVLDQDAKTATLNANDTYFQAPLTLKDFNEADSFKIHFECKKTSKKPGTSLSFLRTNHESEYYPVINGITLDWDNRFYADATSNGSDTNIFSKMSIANNFDADLNTNLIFEIEFTGSRYEFRGKAEGDSNWTIIQYSDNTAKLGMSPTSDLENAYLTFGSQEWQMRDSAQFLGVFYLDKCFVELNGEEAWKGCASASVKGIVNLYAEEGNNVDGSLTQKAATELHTTLEGLITTETGRATAAEEILSEDVETIKGQISGLGDDKEDKLTSANQGDGIEITRDTETDKVLIKNTKPGVWGSIKGSLADQEDLQDALDAKANQATTYTKDEIDSKLSSTFKYKGSVETYADLPDGSEGHERFNGDVYNVKTADPEHDVKAGDNVVWVDPIAPATEGHWDVLAGITDLTEYRKASDQDVIDAGKQDKLTAGDGIALSNTNVISLDISEYETEGNISLKGANVALEGVVTAPTPTAGDDSTKVATTAFIKGSIDTHAADTSLHTSDEEKSRWNDTYTKSEVDALTAVDDSSIIRVSDKLMVQHNDTILDDTTMDVFQPESSSIIACIMQIADTAIDPTPFNNMFYVDLAGNNYRDPAYYNEDGYHGINAWIQDVAIPELRAEIPVFSIANDDGSLRAEPYWLTYNDLKSAKRVVVGKIGDNKFTYTNPVTGETTEFNVSGLHFSTKTYAWGISYLYNINKTEQATSGIISLGGNGCLVRLGETVTEPSGLGVNTQALEYASTYTGKSGIVRPEGGNIAVRDGLLYVEDQSLMPSVIMDGYKDIYGNSTSQGLLETAYGAAYKVALGNFTVRNKAIDTTYQYGFARNALIFEDNLSTGDTITVGEKTITAGTDFAVGETLIDTIFNIFSLGNVFNEGGLRIKQASADRIEFEALEIGPAGVGIACSINTANNVYFEKATTVSTDSRSNTLTGVDLGNFNPNKVASVDGEGLLDAQVPTVNKVASMVQTSAVTITLRTWDDE